MNKHEYDTLEEKLRQAQEIKATIDRIDKTLEKIDNSTGKCIRIEFEYFGFPAYGEPSPPPRGSYDDAVEPSKHYAEISPKYLEMEEGQFADWYSEMLINNLKSLRVKLAHDFRKLKV